MRAAKPKLILAPHLQKLIREKTIKKRDLKLEDEILMPSDPELLSQFQKYDRLVSNFYKETSTRFKIYKDIISYIWIGHLPLLKAKDTTNWKKNLNKLRKRRTLKVTKAQRKVNVRKSFKQMISLLGLSADKDRAEIPENI
jgi:hypothetical protein